MAIVVIDTNILIRNYTLDGAHVVKLLIGCKRCGMPLYIPQIVEHELLGNHKRDVQKSLELLEAETKKLKKRGVVFELPDVDPDKESAKYRKHVAQIKKKFHVQTAPYPEISLEQLVTAPYEQKKPFKASGEGHKDYLIFATILELIEVTGGDVFFLTANTADFCNAAKKLHPDLVAMVPEGHSVTVFPSIHQFYEEILAPQLRKLGPLDNPDAIKKAIAGGTFPGFDLEDKIEAILIDELIEKSVTLEDIESPLSDPSPMTLCAFNVEKEMIEVSKLDEGLLNIDLEGEVELELTGFIDKNYYFHIAESDIEGITIHDADWNDWVVSAYWTTTLPFSLSIVFDQKKHEVNSVSIELHPP